MTSKAPLAILLAAGLVSAPGAAGAQELVTTDLTTFDREDISALGGPVAVRQRPQRGYEAIGIPFGIFRLFPSLEVGPTFDSNVRVTPTDERSAVALTLRPNLNLATDWSSGTLNTYISSRLRLVPNEESESTASLWGGFRSQLDVRRNFQIRTAGEVGTFSEDRISNFSPIGTDEPVQYARIFASVAGDATLGRLRLIAGGDVDRLVFEDARLASNPAVIVDQSVRTRTNVQGRLRLAYDFSPAAGLFGGLTLNGRRYDVTPLIDVNGVPTRVSRDSAGGAVVGGMRLELSRLLLLSVSAGYLWQNYQAPLQDVSGLYAAADLTWYVTELTTILGSVRRDVAESGSLVSSGTLRTAGEMRVDHELRRHIILSTEAEYEQFDFTGIDRIDRRLAMLLSGTYRANRWLELNPSLRYIQQDSTGAQAAPDFNVVRLTFAATLKY